MLVGMSCMSFAMRLIMVVVAVLTLVSFYTTYISQMPKDSQPIRSDFSWMSYLDQNDGLPQNTYQYAVKNYEHMGKRKGRPFLQLSPAVSEITTLHQKIDTFTTACPSRVFDPQKHNLLIYRITDAVADIFPVLKLNLLLFLSTIEDNPCNSNVPTFYVFSISSARTHKLSQYIPNKPNVAVLNWQQKNIGDHLYSHLRTLETINPQYIEKFGAVFLLNIHTRGPLADRNNNQWISNYRNLLDRNNVGIVGHVECSEQRRQVPTLHTQTLVLRVPYILSVLEQFQVAKYAPVGTEQRFHRALQHWFSVKKEAYVHTMKYKVASITQYNMDHKHVYYKNECQNEIKSITKHKNIHTTKTTNTNTNYYAHNAWCYNLTQMVFVPWTATTVHETEFMCPNRQQYMQDYLTLFPALYPEDAKYVQSAMHIDVNEVLYTDVFREVFVQYVEEQKRLSYATNLNNTSSSITTTTTTTNNNAKIVAGSGISSIPNMPHTYTTPSTSITHYTPYTNTNTINTQVCFLVRTSAMHDRVQYADGDVHFVESNVYDFIASLKKQTNPNWRAYLFLTDDRPFGDKLKSIVLGAQDSRVAYYEVESAFRPAFTKTDGGYTATDHVLQQILEHDHTCKYVTVTNADNWYGSEVVQRVLGYKTITYGGSSDSGGGSGNSDSGGVSGSGSGTSSGLRGGVVGGEAPPMLLAPLDSRNFNIEYFSRGARRAEHGEGYRAFDSLLQHSQLVYTTQPVPRVSKIDLASMFLNREALERENVLFANFTDPLTYPCLGCQDGYLAEYLSISQGWEAGRLSIDGLKSVVFHGPSPTLCVATGNVWFDHPAVNKVGCYPRATTHLLRLQDTTRRTPVYDWTHFDSSLGVCLRLSSAAFSQMQDSDMYIAGKKRIKGKGGLVDMLNWT